MTTFRPTRTCPHRLCKPLHLISGIGGLLFIAALAPVSPWILGVAVVGLLFSVAVYRLVHRQTMVDTVREEVQHAVTVTARPGWARAAVAMDAVWALFTLVMVASVLAGRASSDWQDSPSAVLLLSSLAVGVALMALSEGLHRRAVRIEVVQSARTAA